jgi:hypothetical protein
MTHETTCPSCRRVLHVANNVRVRWLTCPRCLAAVAERERPPAPTPPPIPDSPSSRCPGCDRTVEPGWRICPHCEEDLRPARGRDRSLPPPDVDVRRDQGGANVVVVVLGGLILLGVFLFLAFGGWGLVMTSNDGGTVLVCGLLVLGAIVAGLVVLAYGARNRAVTVASGVVGGVVVGAGGVLLLLLLFCMSVLATCNNGCKSNTSSSPSGGSKP